MAISLRLAASTLRIGWFFFIGERQPGSFGQCEILHCFTERPTARTTFFNAAKRKILILVFQQGHSEADGHAKIGAAKAAHHGKGHANHLAIADQQRAAGTAGGGLRIVDNLVRQDVADMALRDQRTNQLAPGQFREHEFRFATAGLDDLLDRFVARARQDGIKSRGVANADQSFPTDGGVFARDSV